MNREERVVAGASPQREIDVRTSFARQRVCDAERVRQKLREADLWIG